MGVELRSIQRKFHTLMDEIKPQIRPRFVVWLDERLAEFKIKGHMDLGETLEDPQWIKNYMTSKRESKAAAIREREARDAGSTTGSIHPKVEAKSESSNGVAHPDPEELDEGKEEKHEEEAATHTMGTEEQSQSQQPEQEFQLVEVKREQMEEEDDDMIIVGESIAPQTPQQPYPSQYNPTRQMYSGFGRNTGPFQRKRQRFGAMSQRPTMAMSAGSRFKSSRPKPNFRSASSSSAAHSSFASHPASSQSLYTSSQSSQLFHTDASSYAGDTHVTYDTGTADPQAFGTETSAYTGESLRIPPHLQAQAASLDLQQSEVPDYEVTESDMYSEEYGDESYDSSYLADTTDSSIIQYDEQGNVVIKGENLAADDSMMEPTPGTSEGTSQAEEAAMTSRKLLYSQISHDGSHHFCPLCTMKSTLRTNVMRHVKVVHLSIKPYACSFCGKTFKYKDDLEGHVNVHHHKFAPHRCHQCGASYHHKRNLRGHLAKSGHIE